MKVIATALPEVLILEPERFADRRGYFIETWNSRTFRDVTGLDVQFVQDNQSRSRLHVLRGLHFQINRPQGKLVRASLGSFFDVVVDLRRSSPRFGQWVGVELSEENRLQVWVPPGFAHGFLVTSDFADCSYKTTDYWSPSDERSVLWSDPAIGIDWKLAGTEPILSAKDAGASILATAQVYE